MSFAAFNTQKSCKKLQPVAEETTDLRDRRHQCVQVEHLWTDKATHDEALTTGRMSRQQPVEQVVEAREQRQEKALCRQVLTCDSGFSQPTCLITTR